MPKNSESCPPDSQNCETQAARVYILPNKGYLGCMFGKLIDLRRALERDQVIPCFQPLVELNTGRLLGFEVLARWQHPELGPILPENFIALAEENGLIGPLMRQVVRKAFCSASDLGETLGLAVNISPLQLRDLTLPSQILEEAERARFAPQRLTIEITESAFLDNLELAKKITGELKAIGCAGCRSTILALGIRVSDIYSRCPSTT